MENCEDCESKRTYAMIISIIVVGICFVWFVYNAASLQAHDDLVNQCNKQIDACNKAIMKCNVVGNTPRNYSMPTFNITGSVQ